MVPQLRVAELKTVGELWRVVGGTFPRPQQNTWACSTALSSHRVLPYVITSRLPDCAIKKEAWCPRRTNSSLGWFAKSIGDQESPENDTRSALEIRVFSELPRMSKVVLFSGSSCTRVLDVSPLL